MHRAARFMQSFGVFIWHNAQKILFVTLLFITMAYVVVLFAPSHWFINYTSIAAEDAVIGQQIPVTVCRIVHGDYQVDKIFDFYLVDERGKRHFVDNVQTRHFVSGTNEVCEEGRISTENMALTPGRYTITLSSEYGVLFGVRKDSSISTTKGVNLVADTAKGKEEYEGY